MKKIKFVFVLEFLSVSIREEAELIEIFNEVPIKLPFIPKKGQYIDLTGFAGQALYSQDPESLVKEVTKIVIRNIEFIEVWLK